MKEKIQDKINRIHQMATSPVKTHKAQNDNSFRANDSLSKSIRNAEEADIFLAELSAAVKIAQIRK